MMPPFFLGLLTGFVFMVFSKALFEPIARKIGVRFIPPAVAKALDLLDPYMPELLGKLNSKELETLVRIQLQEITGESWQLTHHTNLFFKLFDPRFAADKIAIEKRPEDFGHKLGQLVQKISGRSRG